MHPLSAAVTATVTFALGEKCPPCAKKTFSSVVIIPMSEFNPTGLVCVSRTAYV